MDRIEAMQVFARVVERGSFIRAAERSHIARLDGYRRGQANLNHGLASNCYNGPPGMCA